jgi:hypothetical protein
VAGLHYTGLAKDAEYARRKKKDARGNMLNTLDLEGKHVTGVICRTVNPLRRGCAV